MYCAIWDKILQIIPEMGQDDQIKRVSLDFEVAAMQAVKLTFPNADILGCLFHYKQVCDLLE